MNFLYRSAFSRGDHQVDAYERLLLDAMLGDRTLFTRADEVEQAWMWADEPLRGFGKRRQDVHFYPAGTWGPAWANAFIERDGRFWRKYGPESTASRVLNGTPAERAERHLPDSNGEQPRILRVSG